MLGGEFLPSLAAYRFNQLARDHVQDIVVGKTIAETRCGLQITQAPDRLGAAQIRARYEQQIAGAQPKSAAMHEQVADRHLARDPRVVHLESRQAIDHFVVPADLALIDENSERSDGERLAG